MSNVRVRYAPSPTGYLHVGGARTLLFNWLYAKKTGGKLILRIEDTDQQRSTRESEKMILEDIKKLNLLSDESPDHPGSVGPYRQSERLKIYAEHAQRLRDEGKAFYCFCSDELLTQKREAAMKLGKPPHYDGTCARLSPEEAKARLAKGEKAGLRFKAPQIDVTLEDEVRGTVVFKAGMVGDFLITRTPTEGEQEIAAGIGFPVYNFCCVIDDYLMGMTHVIRGEDHLSNTARQLMLYQAFGWKTPVFAHIAMVLGTDRQKLSKRNGDSSVKDYLEKGYLPEALINFLSLLGWWPDASLKPKSGHPEIIAIDELIQYFDLKGLQKSAAVFDVQKLKWMNGFYIRMLPIADVAQRARPFFDAAGVKLDSRVESKFETMIDAIRTEVQLLNELPEVAARYFGEKAELLPEGLELLKNPEAQKVISQFQTEFERDTRDEIDADEIGRVEKQVAQTCGVKGKALFMPFRASVTGRAHGPELKKVIPLLGRKRLLARMQDLRTQAGF